MLFLKCGSGYKIKFNPIHKHEFWELIRLATDKAFYNVDGEVYELSESDLILIPPNINHGCENKNYFSDSVIQFSSCDLPQKPIVIHDTDGNISKLFYIIQKLYVEKEAYYHELIESFLNSIFIYIQKSISFEVTYPFVYTFKDVLYENLSNPEFDVGSAISESGYNPDYFRRCFKKEFHKSPLEYLTSLRITKAKQLITQNDFVSVENVAEQCGFNNFHYFSTCFKKHKGMSPLQYRKMKLAEKEK
jgi:AraC-like DNA-binding protein